MRVAMNSLAAVLILAGGTFFLQGINVLPGSFMTGQIQWAVYGAIFVAIGVALLAGANRKPRD